MSRNTFNQNVLEDVQPSLHIARQFAGIVKQGPLHYREEILEGARFTRLATERDPLISRLSRPIHSSSTSKERLRWFKMGMAEKLKEEG
jgi:hypothetical protein